MRKEIQNWLFGYFNWLVLLCCLSWKVPFQIPVFISSISILSQLISLAISQSEHNVILLIFSSEIHGYHGVCGPDPIHWRLNTHGGGEVSHISLIRSQGSQKVIWFEAHKHVSFVMVRSLNDNMEFSCVNPYHRKVVYPRSLMALH